MGLRDTQLDLIDALHYLSLLENGCAIPLNLFSYFSIQSRGSIKFYRNLFSCLTSRNSELNAKVNAVQISNFYTKNTIIGELILGYAPFDFYIENLNRNIFVNRNGDLVQFPQFLDVNSKSFSSSLNMQTRFSQNVQMIGNPATTPESISSEGTTDDEKYEVEKSKSNSIQVGQYVEDPIQILTDQDLRNSKVRYFQQDDKDISPAVCCLLM